MPLPILSSGDKPRTMKIYAPRPGGGWTLARTANFTYNAALLPTRVVVIDTINQVDSTRYSYNSLGWLVSQQGSMDTTQNTYTFDANNRLASMIQETRTMFSSDRITSVFVYNPSTSKIDTVKQTSLGQFGTSVFEYRYKQAFIRNAQGNVSGFTFYTWDTLTGWTLRTAVYNAVLSNNVTDITIDDYLPETPYTFETTLSGSLIGGSGRNYIDSTSTYDSIRYSGNFTPTSWNSLSQKRLGNTWINESYSYRSVNADSYLLRNGYKDYKNNGQVNYGSSSNNAYTYTAGNVAELVTTDTSSSVQFLTVTRNRYVYSNYITATTPNLPHTLYACPNPVQGTLSITGCQPNAQATVQNAQGKTVWAGALTPKEGTATLATEGWPAGLYLLHTPGSVVRFVKE